LNYLISSKLKRFETQPKKTLGYLLAYKPHVSLSMCLSGEGLCARVVESPFTLYGRKTRAVLFSAHALLCCRMVAYW